MKSVSARRYFLYTSVPNRVTGYKLLEMNIIGFIAFWIRCKISLVLDYNHYAFDPKVLGVQKFSVVHTSARFFGAVVCNSQPKVRVIFLFFGSKILKIASSKNELLTFCSEESYKFKIIRN